MTPSGSSANKKSVKRASRNPGSGQTLSRASRPPVDLTDEWMPEMMPESAPPSAPSATPPPVPSPQKNGGAGRRALEGLDVEAPSGIMATGAQLLRKGNMAYDIPGKMSVNKPTKCIVRIAGSEVKKAKMIIGDETNFQPITISDEMSVQILDNAGGADFKIILLSDAKQAIWDGDFTEWVFEVTPLKHALAHYVLTLKVTLHLNGKSKTIPLIEKSIDVRGGGKKRVVFMAADTGMDLNLNKEEEYVRQQILSGQNHFHYSRILDLTAFKLSEILLNEQPNILHYAGHSNVEGIFLFDDEGQAVLADTAAIEALFQSIKEKLKLECLVLNSCYSQAQATALRAYSQFLVGTTSAIPDTDALAFSQAFYQALASGMDYRNAYDAALAVLKIDLQDNAQSAIYNYYANP